jgi:hypothetical protein
LADLRRELVSSELILDAAQIIRQRVLSRGELVDDRGKRVGGGILRRGDGADLIVGLLQCGRALLELFGVTADLREGLGDGEYGVGGLIDSIR